MRKTPRSGHNSKINIPARNWPPYHSGMESPPAPLYSFKEDHHIDSHYPTEKDAMMAAAYSTGFLLDNRGDDGTFIVRWELR